MLSLSKAAKSALLQPLAERLAGAKLVFFAGQVPEYANAPPARAVLLGEIRLHSPACDVIEGAAVLRADGLQCPRALSDGTPRWFRVVDAAGRHVLDGEIPDDVQVTSQALRDRPIVLSGWTVRA